MRNLVSLLILLLLLSSVSASNIQYAEVSIGVINRPPEITYLRLMPEQLYYDSIISCEADVDDEAPESIKMDYTWYINDVLTGIKTKDASGFSAGDTIKCEAVAIDSSGQESEKSSAEATISETPARVAFMMPLLKSVGVKISADELEKETSLSGITGMVTGQRSSSSVSLLFFLSLFGLILIGINLFGIIIRKTKTTTK